jgi:hypothetical protein
LTSTAATRERKEIIPRQWQLAIKPSHILHGPTRLNNSCHIGTEILLINTIYFIVCFANNVILPQNALFKRNIYWNMLSHRGFPILHDEVYGKILSKSQIFSQVECVFPFISKVLWQWHIYKRNWYAYELTTTFLMHTLSRAAGGEDTLNSLRV